MCRMLMRGWHVRSLNQVEHYSFGVRVLGLMGRRGNSILDSWGMRYLEVSITAPGFHWGIDLTAMASSRRLF